MFLSTPPAGHAPGLPTLTRRSLLRASPALLAPVALASCATEVLSAPAETPIMALYRQWEALADASNAPGLTDEQAEAFDPDRWRIERAIRAEPATDLRDLAAKVLVISGEGVFGLDAATTFECARLVGRDFGKLPRILFEEDV